MEETTAKLHSVHLGNERPIWIREPAEPATAKHLTIFLDGELYRERVGATAIIDQLGATRRIADSWFVFVSMQSVEARWLECPCYVPFVRFVVNELLPWLEQRNPSLRSIGQRTLVGLSYTGLAASFVALEAPGVFRKIISQSGSYWWNEAWLVDRYATQPPPSETAFYLEVGTRETQVRVQHREDVVQTMSQIDGVRRFRDVLAARGCAVEYVEFDGAREFSAWATSLPRALRWALPPGEN